jgi:3-methyladenine DNA glycosylase AlkD
VLEGAALLTALRRTLRQAADVSKAPAMQAYMKSPMPYHGVRLPMVRKLCKSVFADLELANASQWREWVLGLWRGAKFREERYAALSLCGDRRAAGFQTPAAMKMYEELVVTGAWWDYVDDIAAHRLGIILRHHREPMRRKMLSWSRCDNVWKRRSAILSQLEFKADTDLDCSTPVSSPHSTHRSSSSGKPSVGHCVSMHGLTARRSSGMPNAIVLD